MSSAAAIKMLMEKSIVGKQKKGCVKCSEPGALKQNLPGAGDRLGWDGKTEGRLEKVVPGALFLT